MNPSKVKMVEDNDNHYIMHDGKSPFKVPKTGLSDEMHQKIKSMAVKKFDDGGMVSTEPNASFAPTPQASFQPAPQAPMDDEDRRQADYRARDAAALAKYRAQGGFDEGAYEKAKAGEFPKGGAATYDNEKRANVKTDDTMAHEAASKALGIAPLRETGDGEEQAMAQAAPLPRRNAAGRENWRPDDSETNNIVKLGDAAAREKFDAESAQARQVAKMQGEQIEDMKRRAHDDETARLAGSAKSDEAMRKIQDANDEMSRIDTTVDPGRFWATRSTGGKIGAIIGLALGAVGTGRDGVNHAAGMIDKAIDRDIDAQKSEHELRLKKGQQAVAGATSMYGLHHQTLQDDIATRAAAKGTAQEIAAAQAKQLLESTNEPVMKSQLSQLHVGLLQEAQKSKLAAKAEMDRINIEREKNAIENRKVDIQAGKSATGTYTGGTEALNRLSKAWEGAGGVTGLATARVPFAETDAKKYNATLDADAHAIATQMNGGKAPRPAAVEHVKNDLLPHIGNETPEGRRKLAELRRTMQQAPTPDTSFGE